MGASDGAANKACMVRGGDCKTKPIPGRFSGHEPFRSLPVLPGTPDAALAASEERLFDSRVAGGVGWFWGWDSEVIEKAG
jgi:hypothetical protein